MDVVICLKSTDFRIVKKVIRGIRLYLQQPSDFIYIITNRRTSYLFNSKEKKKNHLVLLDENQMIPGLSFDSCEKALVNHFERGVNIYTGWYLQQFLKMGFALTEYAKDEFLIWDSDTIPLHEMTFKKNGKYLFTVKNELHKPYFETTKKLLGFGKLHDRSFIAEHMAIKVSIMRKLIDEIEQSPIKGDYWFEKVIYSTSGKDQAAFSEFETYGNYCTKKFPDLFETRPLETMRSAGMLYGRGVTKKQLRLLQRMRYDTASFEFRDMPSFPRNLYNEFEIWELKMFNKVLNFSERHVSFSKLLQLLFPKFGVSETNSSESVS